jgi:hypothetical protein
MRFKSKPGVQVFMNDGSLVTFDASGIFEGNEEQSKQLAALGYAKENVTVTQVKVAKPEPKK